MGIHKALKANYWLNHNLQLPKDKQTEITSDIEELIFLKMQVSKADNSESFFSNNEGEGLVEALKKNPRKNVSSALFSITSSPKSPEQQKHARKFCNFPLAFSAETPQFTTSIKGMTFSPESRNYDKLQDIAEISSIDFDEKRCTPIKMKNEKHLEEMWNTIKKLEFNMNQQIEMCNYKVAMAEEKAGIALQKTLELSDEKLTERVKYESEDKAVWPALSRIEKFMTASSKKEYLFEKRIETVEEEIKNCRETFQKVLNLIEDQKLYLQDGLKEKATKIDIEILEKNSSKLSNKLNFLNSEVENIRKDISRLSHPNKQIENLAQDILKLKDLAKSSDFYNFFEKFQKDMNLKYSQLEYKITEISNQNSPENKGKNERNPRNEASPIGKATVPLLDLPKVLKPSSLSVEYLRNRMNFSTERGKPSPLSENFLPGEAESLVLSAIIEKANNSRVMESLKKQANSRSISPIIGFKAKIKNLESENTPSAQLQETLRSRGIPIDSKVALTERRK